MKNHDYNIDHMTCLHFAWPLEYHGDFPLGKSVCICMQSLYILYKEFLLKFSDKI